MAIKSLFNDVFIYLGNFHYIFIDWANKNQP